MPTPKALRISPAGLRGVVGAGLTASHVIDFASAFGTFVEPGKPVILGRDPRASGVMLREGVLAGLLACGHQVVDIGVASSPVIQHAIRNHGGAGGIAISASHNAAEWNALRFFGRDGSYLSTAESGELLDIYHLRKFRYPDWSGIGAAHEHAGAIDEYLDELARHFDFGALKRFKVVVDCCNGTSSPILRRLNERFGFAFILINEKLEGVRFAHEPLITRDIIGLQLAPLIKPLGADIGFLFDVDSDRVGIATESGEPLSEELILPLIAEWMLPRGEGKVVISNLSSTALLEHVATRHGGKVVRVPVGRQATIDALALYRPEQIAVAGEGTGAVMMPQFQFIYDGIASMLAVLSLLAERGEPIGEIIRQYPSYSMLKGQVPLTSPRIPELLMNLQKQYHGARMNVSDGLRADWPDRWFHVRVSQTEPVVRVICEQKGERPVALYESLLEAVRSIG